jgi:hypothetical protein
MAPVVLWVALTAAVPKTSFDDICQGAKVSSLPGEEASAFQACIRDERSAKDELQKRWGNFTADMREACAEPAGLTFSYVELLTCLEMQPGGRMSDFPVTRLEPPTPHER